MKVIIVDDEELIRDGLSSLDWNSIGIEFAGAASNGKQALEIIKDTRPNIVITDISMPKADGIWLAEKLSILLPDVKIIFLTGYNNFEFAQKAIEYNVCEYVLKPVQPKHLLELVKKVSLQILKEGETTNKLEAIQKNISESRFFLKDWFLNSITTLGLTAEKLFERFECFGISLKPGSFIALTVSFALTDDSFNSLKAFNDINKIISKNEIRLSPFYDDIQLSYILNIENEYEEIVPLRVTFAIADAIKEYLDYNFEVSYNIGIGYCVQDIKQVPYSYQSAVAALKYKFYIGENQIIYLKDMEPFKQTSDYKVKLQDEYIAAIKVGNDEYLIKIVNSIFEELIKNREGIDTIKRICLELIVNTSRAISGIGQNPEILFKKTDLWSVINRCTTVEQLQKLIIDINSVAIFQIFNNRISKNQNIIEMVKEMIQDQCCEGITLENAAEQVFISPNYLSFLFKKETNMTFKEYLINEKINKAKILLKDPQYKIYEIAKIVGYSDPRYFSDIFRRTIGLTPAQYREKKTLDNTT